MSSEPNRFIERIKCESSEWRNEWRFVGHNTPRLRLRGEIRLHGLNLGLVLQRRRLRPLRSSRRRLHRGLEFRHVSLELGVDATLEVGVTNHARKENYLYIYKNTFLNNI